MPVVINTTGIICCSCWQCLAYNPWFGMDSDMPWRKRRLNTTPVLRESATNVRRGIGIFDLLEMDAKAWGSGEILTLLKIFCVGIPSTTMYYYYELVCHIFRVIILSLLCHTTSILPCYVRKDRQILTSLITVNDSDFLNSHLTGTTLKSNSTQRFIFQLTSSL